jgi:hypothetical protein
MLTDWMAARQFQVIEHPPYTLDVTTADFFLFPEVKRELASLTLTQEIFKKEWEEAVKICLQQTSSQPLGGWYERCEKCVDIAGSYIEKSSE